MNTDLRTLLITEIDRIKRAIAASSNTVAALELLVSQLDTDPGGTGGVKALLDALDAETEGATSADAAQDLLDAIAQGEQNLSSYVSALTDALAKDEILRQAVEDAAARVVVSPEDDDL